MTEILGINVENDIVTAIVYPAECGMYIVEADKEDIISGLTRYVDDELIIPTEEEKEEFFRKQAEHQTILRRIAELKHFLADSDYKAIKHSEGLISDEDYEPIKLQRQAWRNEINSYEN